MVDSLMSQINEYLPEYEWIKISGYPDNRRELIFQDMFIGTQK
jgi:hypothetical protein